MTKENINIEAVKEFFMKLQTDILNAIEIVDGNNFLVDSWQRSEGGGGTTCILENGKLFETIWCSVIYLRLGHDGPKVEVGVGNDASGDLQSFVKPLAHGRHADLVRHGRSAPI